MATAEWMVLCERAKLEDDKLNLYNVHEALLSTAFPFNLENLQVAFRLAGNPTERISFRLQVWQGNEKVGETSEMATQLTEHGERVVAISGRGLIVPRPGKYSIMLVSGETVLVHSLYSIQEKPS